MAMHAKRVEINVNDGRGTITVDGQDIKGVRAARWSSEAGDVAVLQLDIIVPGLTIVESTDTNVEVSPEVAASLQALGWISPEASKQLATQPRGIFRR